MSRRRREGSGDRPQVPVPSETMAAGPAEYLDTTPIVGVGASAGGLDAFSELLGHLPPAPGFALVLVMHLQPTHPSDLAAILGRKTSMPVVQAEDGMRLDPDHVYVIPPNVEMRLKGDTFVLSPRPTGASPSLTVDIFLTSLAEQHGNRAIGVVLSGSASDGTKGLAAIKAEDGITLAQDPETATHRSMPESAIAAGVADAVLPIAGIADELVRLAAHPYVRDAGSLDAEEAPPLSPDEESALAGIVARVRKSTGLDLSHYKRPTLLRRIGRRVAMRHASGMNEYAALLDSEPEEAAELFADVLVRVTSFFRDPEVFEALKSEAFPSIVSRKRADEPVRIWVPGCATGQEPYSIAIVLFEYLEATGSTARVQVFASDLREDDLAIARRGVFPPEIAAEVSEERLARFFVAVEGGYQIGKAVREACVFARHDVTRDPPFAHIDLVSCRNLLIYLDATLQRRLLGTLHYALVPDGVLVLGNSEGTGSAPGLFARTSTKGILTRLPGPTPVLAFGDATHSAPRPLEAPQFGPPIETQREREWSDAQRQLDAMLLDKYAPAAVLVDQTLHIRQIRGDAGDYLRFRPGDATLDLASMISVGLATAVRSAIAEVRESGKPAHRSGVRSKTEGGHSAVEIVVVPVVTADQPISFAVLFNEGSTVSRADGETGLVPTELVYLRQELEAATERLRILREGRDAANESLRAANEEIQSSNEELQSMNEELETAKEELQSANEELTTLNDELQARNVEMAQRNDDLNNLLVSASIAMLVLDSDLRIRRFTAQAAEPFSLIPGDIGRRATDIRWRLEIDDVAELLDTVIRSGEPREREVQDDSGHWFRMTVRPYVTGDGRIGGAVVTLLDINVLHREKAERERQAEALDGLVSQRTAELEAALQRLETAANVKNAFLANMSHELRTPLNSIIGFSTILLDGLAGELNEEQRRQLEMVLVSGRHLLAIVSDLLDIERITAGAMPVSASEFRIGDVIDTVGGLIRPIAEAKGVDLRLPEADPGIELHTDEQKVRQILLNLVSNAVKYTDEGHVTVSASATAGECVIVVEDTGRGMTRAELEHAFKEFEQVGYDAERLNDGTGLGLSIATRLAQLLGGTLSAESTAGVGSSFTLTLPLRLEEPAEQE